MGAATYPQQTETLIAHQDTVPLPFAKLARRVAQLPKHEVHRITLWFNKDGEPEWVFETVGKVENRR